MNETPQSLMRVTPGMNALPKEARGEILLAHARLEQPALAMRLSNLLGWPIEQAVGALPAGVQTEVDRAVALALRTALHAAVVTLDPRRDRVRIPRWDRYSHRWLGIGSGAVGGATGLAGALVELPFFTTLAMRSIGAIAVQEGEDFSQVESRMACLQVFALGGYPRGDDAAETGYYGLRLSMALSLTRASAYVAHNGLVRDAGAPALVALMAALASRFGVTLSQKVAAQAIPVIGAFGGATVNLLFIQHFQRVAAGHFALRRLERIHGEDTVKAFYRSLADSQQNADG